MSESQVWTELSLHVPEASVEVVADLLQDLTGNGVTIEPPIEALGPDDGYVLDAAAPYVLRGYIFGDVSTTAVAFTIEDGLRALGLDDMSATLQHKTIRQEDWAENWKQHYQIERVGRVVVRPAWRDYDAQPGEIVVSLDPGMAFGTGQHPTTRMCLQALQERLHPGDHVLDLGCGSGILAFAAVALGSGPVIAIDTEEQAVKATLANAALNEMQLQIETRLGSIDAAGGEVFDLVLANINAATLTALAPQIAASLKPGAPVMAGGVINERETACLAALVSAGLRHEQTLSEGDWRTFVLVKS